MKDVAARGSVVVIAAIACGPLMTGSPMAEAQDRARHVADERRAERLEAQPSGKVSADKGWDKDGGRGRGPAGDGIAWLKANQNASGSWGSTYEFVDTCTVVETLAVVDAECDELAYGASWLASQSAGNYDYLARQIGALAGVPGYESYAEVLADELLAVRNSPEWDDELPNWPEGGWGLAEGYETDCMTTAVALHALNAVGLAGGTAVQDEPLDAGATNIHEFDVPDDAVNVRIRIEVFDATVRLRVKEGSPPDIYDPYFELPPGAYYIVFPDSGLPVTPGHNYISIENTGAAGSYSMHVSYETPEWDTRTIWDPYNTSGQGYGPLEYLLQSQNVDGGWGLQRGEDTELYTTIHVLLALADYIHYDLAAPRDAGLDYLRLVQLGDGSFGYYGIPLPYVTALASLAMVRPAEYPYDTPTENAIAALLAMQDGDGSWDGYSYDTALAVMALWDHNQTPTADAGADQWVFDVNPPEGSEDVTLSGWGDDVDGTIESYVWTEDGEEIATGQSPIVTLPRGRHVIVLTVTDDGGKWASDSLVVMVTGPLETFFEANMDTDPGWTTEGLWAWGVPTGNGGSQGGNDPTSGFTGTNVYGYNLTGGYENDLPSTCLTTTAIDCSAYAGVHLKFRRWLCVESSTYDHASVQVSTDPDDPNSWVAFYDHEGATLIETSWSLQDYDISEVADGQPLVYIRWVMGPTDYAWTYGGWNVDDAEVYGGSMSPTLATIGGSVMTSVGTPIPGVEVLGTNSAEFDVTDGEGYYELSLPYGEPEAVTPCKDGWWFDPPSRTYNPVTGNLIDEDYVGTLVYDVDPPDVGDESIGVGDLSRFATSWLQDVPPADPLHDFDCDSVVGVGDFSYFVTAWLKSVFDTGISYPDCWLCNGRAREPNGEPWVELHLVAVARPSPEETLGDLPHPSVRFVVGQPYFVELWARDMGPAVTGLLTSVYADVAFDAKRVEAKEVHSSALFNAFSSGSIGESMVDELGGSTLRAGPGSSGSWVRVATIELRAAAPGQVCYELQESRTGLAAYGRGRVAWESVERFDAWVEHVELQDAGSHEGP